MCYDRYDRRYFPSTFGRRFKLTWNHVASDGLSPEGLTTSRLTTECPSTSTFGIRVARARVLSRYELMPAESDGYRTPDLICVVRARGSLSE